MKFTDLKDTLKKVIQPKLTEKVMYKIGDEVFNRVLPAAGSFYRASIE